MGEVARRKDDVRVACIGTAHLPLYVVALLVMGPHTKNLDHVFFLKNLIYEAMLDVDSAGYGAFEVPDQCFVGRWSSEGVYGENAHEPYTPHYLIEDGRPRI